jgi:hypothetical protein
MKSKSQIIAEQESIGNVEITEEELCANCGHLRKEHYNKQTPTGKIFMCCHFDKKYCGCKKFTPREVVHHEETEAFGGKLLISDEEKIGCGKDMGEWYCGNLGFNVKTGKMEVCLCPSCQKKQDNHSQNKELAGSVESAIPDATDEEPELHTRKDCIRAGSDIPSSKIFEDIIKLIEKNFKKRDNLDIDEWEEIKSKIKEKWGKIERWENQKIF